MRKHDPDELFRVIKKFLKLPRPAQIAVVVLIIVFVVVCLIVAISKKEEEPPPARPERRTRILSARARARCLAPTSTTTAMRTGPVMALECA